MARDASGTYSLPNSPVVGGTVVASTWANTTLADIRTEITSSLDRSGRGGMLAALRGVDGTVAAPAMSFTGETGTGIYRIGAGNPGLAVSGQKVQEWETTGTTVTGTLAATGAATLGSAAVTGALSVGGGVSVTSGNVALSQAAGQSVTKSGGSLTLGTSDANDVVINRNGSAALTFGAAPAFAGKPTAASTVAGDGATTLTTKDYLESRAPRAWGRISVNAGGVATVVSGYNVASAGTVGSIVSISFTNAISDANYCTVVSATLDPTSAWVDTQLAGQLTVNTTAFPVVFGFVVYR